jgi:hypothetical protein
MMLSIDTQTFRAEPTKVASVSACPHSRFESLGTDYDQALVGRYAR